MRQRRRKDKGNPLIFPFESVSRMARVASVVRNVNDDAHECQPRIDSRAYISPRIFSFSFFFVGKPLSAANSEHVHVTAMRCRTVLLTPADDDGSAQRLRLPNAMLGTIRIKIYMLRVCVCVCVEQRRYGDIDYYVISCVTWNGRNSSL